MHVRRSARLVMDFMLKFKVGVQLFTEGETMSDDCDHCVHQYYTGQDGTVKACRKYNSGHACSFEERDFRTCPVCGQEWDRGEMRYTKDCHGITFRLVCPLCWNKCMEKGYDGEYYDEFDEQTEDDY